MTTHTEPEGTGNACALDTLLHDESLRRREFPVVGHRLFMAHAGVAPIPYRAAAAIEEFAQRAAEGVQEGGWVWPRIAEARRAAARLLGCEPDEVALLGPTSLGLSLVAHGLAWSPGDEVIYYEDDYPANVYPWTGLGDLGVKPVPIRTEDLGRLGAVEWNAVEARITPRTRLVSLASCHFLSGYRIDIDGIGRRLQERGILFCVDGIQTLGAFPTPVRHVDFLSADSHKWMMGPVGAGIFYVRRSRQELLRPILRGAWNIESPGFIAQREIRYEPGARRYEPGSLNLPGILGMLAAMNVLDGLGPQAIAERLLVLRARLVEGLCAMGFRLCGWEDTPGDGVPIAARSGIVTVAHPSWDAQAIAERLAAQGVVVSLRSTREGRAYVRFSPHAYITDEEVGRVLSLLRVGLA